MNDDAKEFCSIGQVVSIETDVKFCSIFNYSLNCCFLRTLERIVKKVIDKAGISKPVSSHVLRHTFSVNCIEKGTSTRALQTLLGHDRLMATELYLNLSPENTIREFSNKW